jgi:hypothetical protein
LENRRTRREEKRREDKEKREEAASIVKVRVRLSFGNIKSVILKLQLTCFRMSL